MLQLEDPGPFPKFPLLDRTKHAPMPVVASKPFRGTGITLACSHASCGWRYGRVLVWETDSITELFALYHPPMSDA